MKSKEELASLSMLLCKTAEMIETTTEAYEASAVSNPELADAYEHFLLDEVTHVQILALEMTRTMTEESETNGDDSAFVSGELNSVIGEREREYPEPTKE